MDRNITYNNIIVKGARVNNLKNVDVDFPRNKLTVVTGLSGSGKSSLAFDTLYAEGQRRYVESLSAYARQFLGRMAKPEVDRIAGLPPAIAIEQKVTTRNPRSTVGTSTEIYDYLRLLFARVGRTFSPISGVEVKKHSVDDVVNAAIALPERTRIAVAAPIVVPPERDAATHLDKLRKQGFSRLVNLADGSFMPIEQAGELKSLEKWALLIDRLASSAAGSDEMSRLADSVESAFFEGHDHAYLIIYHSPKKVEIREFSKLFEADGMTFMEPNEQMFNFNSPYGACPRCEGFGKTLGIDERLVVPDPTLSVYDDAVACWRGEKMSQWKRDLIKVASRNDFPIHRPYEELTQAQKDFLWHGNADFEGIDGFFRMLERNAVKIQYRVIAARYRGKTLCPVCHGTRLKPEVNNVKICGKTITELVELPVDKLSGFFENLTLSQADEKIAERILIEIRSRLQFLSDVGLGYLTLDRLSNTLSGGESQRINLATSLGSSLMGSLYILDEPSIGLHSRDTQRLIGVLKRLRDIGNTVVVVEHDEEIMRAADYLVDVGPDAGSHGGEIVYQGPIPSRGDEVDAPRSHTLRYLNGSEKIEVPKKRRKPTGHIDIIGAAHNNLKNIDVRFPLGVMTAVTGVSGSGKSTLVREILYKALLQRLGESNEAPGRHKMIRGDINRITAVEFVDQNPIGKSSRSNPATYLKAYDEIRTLYSDQQAARQMGMTPAYFSFNTDGGRCEKCKGEGRITIEMQFMADMTIECDECHGMRFKRDVLDVTYRGKNINDILELTVDEAITFFSEGATATTARIVKRLQPLADVGLGYIKLGQTSSTLSGGENQRVKLAYYLSLEKANPTMFIFDEPTTGLHFHDINRLMDSFRRLIDRGHTIVVIEHNIDVIKSADHVIDIGPEGGAAGGEIVATGTPEEIAKVSNSYTGKFLRENLEL